MAILLSIRNNLRDADREQESENVITCQHGPVYVGSGPKCDCRLEDEDLPAQVFTLNSDEHGRHWCLEQLSRDVTVYRNHDAVGGQVPVQSGDELRAGHWTVRCYKVHPAASRLGRTETIVTVVKSLLIAACLAQIGFIAWLPHQVRSSAVWNKEEMRQKTVMLLEQLRGNEPSDAGGELRSDARALLEKELAKRASYVTENRGDIPLQQWRTMYADLVRIRKLRRRLGRKSLWRDAPQLNTAAAIDQILRNSSDSSGEKR